LSEIGFGYSAVLELMMMLKKVSRARKGLECVVLPVDTYPIDDIVGVPV
jgi:hypothetical protein